MIRRTLSILLLAAALIPATAGAQDQKPEQGRPANRTPTRPPGDEPPPASSTNIQVEVTISDYAGSGPPQKKTVSVIVTDGYSGRVRSSRSPTSPVLNVDATPRVNSEGRVWLRLILEYSPASTEKMPRGQPINESLTVTLQSGKPLVVSQGADPSTDRKVTVEVTATILK
jgi:hypothetical protein